jgi:hypothetical protein
VLKYPRTKAYDRPGSILLSRLRLILLYVTFFTKSCIVLFAGIPTPGNLPAKMSRFSLMEPVHTYASTIVIFVEENTPYRAPHTRLFFNRSLKIRRATVFGMPSLALLCPQIQTRCTGGERSCCLGNQLIIKWVFNKMKCYKQE